MYRESPIQWSYLKSFPLLVSFPALISLLFNCKFSNFLFKFSSSVFVNLVGSFVVDGTSFSEKKFVLLFTLIRESPFNACFKSKRKTDQC